MNFQSAETKSQYCLQLSLLQHDYPAATKIELKVGSQYCLQLSLLQRARMLWVNPYKMEESVTILLAVITVATFLIPQRWSRIW